MIEFMEKKMIQAKFLLVAALWLTVSNFHFEASGDTSGDVMPSPAACVNCSKQLSTPPSGDPSNEASTPPPSPSSSSPPPSGYSIYDTPPPPHDPGKSKCPPAAGVECCTPSVPYTYAPPIPYTYAPPNRYPYTYAPPYPYTYVPYGGGEGSISTLLPILAPLMVLFSSFIFLL